MKYHYLAALFCLIYAGLSFYQGFYDAELGPPIWIGILLSILGVSIFFRNKLGRRLKVVVVLLTLIVIGVMVITDFAIERSVASIAGGIALVYVVAVALFHDRPFVETEVRSWSTPFAYIVMGVLVIFKLLTVFAVSRTMEQSVKADTEIQRPAVSREVSRSNDLQADDKAVLNDLQEKAMAIITSEEVQEEIKAAATTGKQPEFLKSFSNFRDYMISKGMTEFAILDDVSSHYQELFQKQYPGKIPSDLDPEMRQRLIDMIQEFGYEKGRKKFLSTPEIAVWTAARFNILSDNPGDISEWTSSIYATEFENIKPAQVTGPPPSTPLPDEISLDEIVSDMPSAEIEQVPADHSPKEPWQEPTIPDPAARKRMASGVEREKVVTEVSPSKAALPTDTALEASLKAQFSPERFQRAMSTLEQYGSEEGLRRLRESDPEVAKQIEASRNEVERQRNREDKGENYR